MFRRRRLAFPVRFAVFVAGLVAVAAGGAVALAAAETSREVRQEAVDRALTRATLAAGLLRAQRTALADFVSRLAPSICPVLETGDAAALVRQLELAGVEAGPHDVLGTGGLITVVVPSPGAGTVAVLAQAARSREAIAAVDGDTAWLVVASDCPAGVLFVARLLDAATVTTLVGDVGGGSPSALALVHRGRMLAAAGLADLSVPPGPSGLGRVADAGPGMAGVERLGGRDLAVVAVELGGDVEVVAVDAVASSTGLLGGLALPATVFVVAVVLLAALTVMTLVEREVRAPLRRLDRAVAALAREDFDAPLPRGRDDEVGRLAARFDDMRRRLRAVLAAAEARAEIGLAVSTAEAVEPGLVEVCRHLCQATDATVAAVVLTADVESDASVHGVGLRGRPDPVALLSGEGPVAAAARLSRPTIVEACVLPGSVEHALGMRHLCAAPLCAAGRSLGALVVADGVETFDDAARDLVVAGAEQVALALARERLLSLARHQASTDGLTGLYNYRYLVDYLERQVAVAERAQSPLSVLMLDLDRFKVLNDTYGHQVGDEALRLFAWILSQSIRRSDLAARYGGEEFVCVMSNTDAAEARVVAEKIRVAVARTALRCQSEVVVRFTVSVGGATFPDDATDARQLLRAADAALYRAKAEGRDRVRFAADLWLGRRPEAR